MQEKINQIALKMKEHFNGNQEKVQHNVRVYTISKTIGELEKLPPELQTSLEIISLVHEIEQIEEIDKMLREIELEDKYIERVIYIMKNRKDYKHICGLDHQILTEADFIVHMKEDNLEQDEIVKIGNKYFFTNYGRGFLKKAFKI